MKKLHEINRKIIIDLFNIGEQDKISDFIDIEEHVEIFGDIFLVDIDEEYDTDYNPED